MPQVLFTLVSMACAEEGMWLFNAPPTELGLSRPWLDHLRLATVLFQSGSRAFVSPDGLIVTNHHIMSDCMARMSDAKRDFVKDGFYAARREEEYRCPGQEVTVVTGIEDVSGQVSGATPLYSGAVHHLYRYHRYTDVRLVFAPELGVAFFGGDADNFNYPRYALDIIFVRAYEDGKPARTPEFLRWSRRGAREGDRFSCGACK